MLTKPGIIKGNVLSMIAGYVFASGSQVDLFNLVVTVLGVSFAIGSACVFNNVLDINIDTQMARTKNRATVTGDITIKNAILFGTVLFLVGFGLLIVFTNMLTVAVGLIGVVSYVVIYGFFKRRTRFATEIGTISGATPILAGYTSVTGHFDISALIIFLFMVIWQIPHFYAISIFRLTEYKKAKIPVVSIVKGINFTKRFIIIYIGIYTGTIVLSYIFEVTGIVFLIGGSMLGLYWLFSSARDFDAKDNNKWARKSFGASLTTLLAFCVLLPLDALIT